MLLLVLFLLKDGVKILIFLENGDGLGEVLLSELALLINDKVDSVTACRENVVLERGGSEVSVHDGARLLFDFNDPLCKLS